ncbi:MAG TPA: O-antigen ligase family protein [Candidatus Acidoferrales bacterium]|nr:O-antigen ligase family protein [Candidatus Acidoferrales bacterium]
MSPTLALFLWLVLLLGLLRFDPAKDSGTSLALWVPLIWMFIVGSRMPSQWLDMQVGTAAQAFEEGNPLNRSVFLALTLLAMGILLSRSFKWSGFLTRNRVLIAFVSFALLSVLWSDFPFITFKRWFRDLGNYLMVLVILSDPHPLEAVRTVLRRLSFLLIPLSIVVIKYYGEIGRHYSQWTGTATYVGVATSKNMLGLLCLVSGIFLFWDTVTRWAEHKERRTQRIILVNVAFIAMTLWLLHLAHSATSSVCLVIGCLVIAAAHSRFGKRHPGFLQVLCPASFFLYLILAFGFGMNAEMVSDVGRNPTLTDRTFIWKILLSMKTNPLVGTGYQSFWLGSRLQRVWQSFPGINEAHNGYLDIYLTLGVMGLVLLVGFLIASYGTICKRIRSASALASLSLAIWTILLFYNVTEAAFDGGLLWVMLLLGVVVIPEYAEARVASPVVCENAPVTGRWPSTPTESTRFAEMTRRFSAASRGSYQKGR